MGYTAADYADAIWSRTPRNLASGAAVAPVGYAQQVAQAVWSHPGRTLTADPPEPLLFEVELQAWLIATLGAPAWPGLIPQKTALPALVYTVTSIRTELDLGGTDELRAWTVQFDAWGRTRLEVASLIARLEAVLLDYTGPMGRAWVFNATLAPDGDGFQPPADGGDRPLQRKTAEYLIQFRDSLS